MSDYDFLMIHGPYAERFAAAEYAVQTKAAEGGDKEDEEEQQSYILNFHENIAIISVRGMLTNKNSYYNRYYGLLAYQEIRLATIQAIQKGVGAILFDYATPGGDASGMIDLADFISQIPIPTISHASGSMASAGYFLGMQSDHIHSSLLSEVGSIGVLVKIYDITEMNSRMGVKVERFRSGNLKAVGDPEVSMSKEERAYVEGQIKYMADVFFSSLSAARGIPNEMLTKLGITTGRTFMGADAVAVGLVDSIQSFDKSVLKAYNLATNYLDNNGSRRLF